MTTGTELRIVASRAWEKSRAHELLFQPNTPAAGYELVARYARALKDIARMGDGPDRAAADLILGQGPFEFWRDRENIGIHPTKAVYICKTCDVASEPCDPLFPGSLHYSGPEDWSSVAKDGNVSYLCPTCKGQKP